MQGSARLFKVWEAGLAILVAAMLAVPSAHAQIDTGTIQGTITDQTGGVIPNAKVSLTNEGTNFTLTTTTNASGNYVFTPVKIGDYSVTAEATGFAKAVQSHLTLHIAQTLVADLTLKPGVVTQTVEVTAAPPALQTQSAAVGQVVNQRNINNLPLNGRNFTFLAQIVAGVNTPQADTRGNAASGAFAANGLRPAQNNYLLDGIDNNEDTVDFLNGTNYVVLPPVDALSEFKVQTNDYSAQYGRSGAGILNATIKSGTNHIHGDLFEFLRNDKVDAADFFEDSAGIPNNKGEFRQNQFGGTIGGPILHDKLFYFGDFEGLRRRQGTVFTNGVPTATERASNFTDFTDLIKYQFGITGATHTDLLNRTFPAGTIFDPATTRAVTAGTADQVTGLMPTASGFVRDPFSTCPATTTDFTGGNITACKLNMIKAARLDANAIKLLGLYPAPTGPGITRNNETHPVTRENRNAFDTRMDWNKSDHDQMFGRFSYVNDPQFIAAPFSGIADGGAFQQGNQQALSIQGALSYTHVFSPTTVNEARLGENRIHTSRFGPVATQFGIPAQFGISSSIPQCCENGGLPAFGIGGLNTLGSNAFLPSDEISQTTQVADNFTKIYGNHSFHMGMEYQHIKYSTLQPPWSHGQYNYGGTYTRIPKGQSDSTGIAQFLLTPIKSTVPGGIDYVGGTDGTFSSNISLTDDGKNYFGSYFQDDWKFNPKLTLNLGLRWDYFGQTYEHFGAQANFIPGRPCFPASSAAGCAQYLIPTRRNTGLSASFLSLMPQDGINIASSNNRGLGDSQKANFAPRVGFAYQINPKLVARGGFGIFYGGFENRGFSPNIGENYPFQFNFSFFSPDDQDPISATHFSNFAGTPCANYFPFEAGFDCTPLKTSLVNAAGLSLRGIQFNYKTPYTEGYNFSFQYAFTPSLSLTMAYVGNTTRHLEVFPGDNQVSTIIPPGTDTHKASSPGIGLYIPYPDFSQGQSYAATEGNSYYHGLQATLEQRLSNGLNFLTTYTWSRCRSDAGDLLNGGAIGYRAPYVPGFGIQHDYGDCNFDIRNVFHFSGGYELPFGRGKRFMSGVSGVANELVSGWQTVWNSTLEGGQPRTIGCAVGTTSGTGCDALIIPGVNRHGSGAPDHFYNAAAFTQPCQPGTTKPAANPKSGFRGCVPGLSGLALLGGTDGQVSGPGIGTLDFSLFKQFRLSEKYRLEFRSEFFNILNHPTFNPPGFGGNGVVAISGSTDITNTAGKFGEIGSTRFPFNDPRQIQFALKLYF